MNYIALATGDTKITDMPNCVDPFLARMVQVTNDIICKRTSRQGLLCQRCSNKMVAMAERTIGTANVATADVYLQILKAASKRNHYLDKRQPEKNTNYYVVKALAAARENNHENLTRYTTKAVFCASNKKVRRISKYFDMWFDLTKDTALVAQHQI